MDKKRDERYEVGDLIYWTQKHIALLMKPKNAGGLWKIGIIIQNKSPSKYIILSEGTIQECTHTMAMKFDKAV